MIYKISPRPSLLKRGKERENFAKEGKRKGRNDPLDYAKSHFFLIIHSVLNNSA
jgi:hypothetical protein